MYSIFEIENEVFFAFKEEIETTALLHKNDSWCTCALL